MFPLLKKIKELYENLDKTVGRVMVYRLARYMHVKC